MSDSDDLQEYWQDLNPGPPKPPPRKCCICGLTEPSYARVRERQGDKGSYPEDGFILIQAHTGLDTTWDQLVCIWCHSYLYGYFRDKLITEVEEKVRNRICAEMSNEISELFKKYRTDLTADVTTIFNGVTMPKGKTPPF